MSLEKIFLQNKELSVQGRYITNKEIIEFLENSSTKITSEVIGYSVEDRPIHCVSIGEGKTKLFLWSQMHGNESTTTKALLDFINYLMSVNKGAHKILEQCSLKMIPILNPDGALAYTRVNANKIDLNRDAQSRTQPESKILRKIYDEFQPDYCFNLHDQRTIFNVGNTSKPATVSFLAPSHDEERSISEARSTSMKLIVAMNEMLQKKIPGQVGRYDDGFNANCIGDTFQMLDTPTILFESGHFPKDYDREETRKYIFYAILTAVNCISTVKLNDFSQSAYFDIPENGKQFLDVLIYNARNINPKLKDVTGILYKEVLRDGKIMFEPIIDNFQNLNEIFGHAVYDASKNADLEALKNSNIWKVLIADD